MAVAGARRNLPLLRVVQAQIRGQRGVDRLHHRDLNQAALATGLAREQGRDHAGIQMHTSHEIGHSWPDLDRRPVFEAVDAHEPRHGLHRNVHGRVIHHRAGAAITRTGRVHQPWIDLAERVVAQAQALHRALRKVFNHHVGLGHHGTKQLLATRRLQVKGDAFLVRIEHGKGHGRAAHLGAPAQVFAALGFDLDDPRARHRHQEGAIRPVVDLAEVNDGNATQGALGLAFHCCLPSIRMSMSLLALLGPAYGQIQRGLRHTDAGGNVGDACMHQPFLGDGKARALLT